MKISFYIIPFLLFTSNGLKAQHSDCDKLLRLTDTIYEAKNIKGFGDKMEFKNNYNDSISSFPQETNSIWYLIQVPNSGNFTFDIISTRDLDDWDFLLYEHKSQFCRRIDSNKIKPIRTNLSRSPTTGLSLLLTDEFSSPGINNNYSKFVTAKAGEEYVLVVNNPKRANSNHTLLLHFPLAQKVEKTIEPVKNEVVKEIPKLNFTFEIKDDATNLVIPANASISGLRKEIIELNDITNYQVILEKASYKINLTVYAQGFMLYSTKININNKSKNDVHQEIRLERIVEGKKVSLDDIQFQAASDKFLKTAESSLKSLLNFMVLNPAVKIEVGGHVNGPGQSNSQEFKKLSLDRAIAVKDFLIENGIEMNRIQFLGYGNSKMIYPDPKIEDEHSANRRVEIKIMSK